MGLEDRSPLVGNAGPEEIGCERGLELHERPLVLAKEKETDHRVVEHDVIVLQFPLFWYSTPSLLKEWIDLVLEHGFAYGESGDACEGKAMMLATTAADPESAYRRDGYQRYTLREFLRPLEQTARLCGMRFLPPYVLFQALRAVESGLAEPHARGYCLLLEALRDNRFDRAAARALEILTFDTLPIREAD